MSHLINLAQPLSSAKYVTMQTFMDPEVAPGQKQHWYPWPYVEGLTMAEAMNELSFIATGLYGKPMPKQNGAPLRLVAPWKYGFKQIKSIVRFTFTKERPKSFWEKLAAREYGFWANVNPDVPHRAGAKQPNGFSAMMNGCRHSCSMAMVSSSPICTRAWKRNGCLCKAP